MRFAKAGLAGVALGASALALVAGAGGARAAGEMVLTVTIESVTTPTTLRLPDGGGTPAPLSPGVAYAGKEASPFFTLGKPASKGVRMQAEAGMPDGIAAEVKGAVEFGQSNDLFYTPKSGSMALFDKACRPDPGRPHGRGGALRRRHRGQPNPGRRPRPGPTAEYLAPGRARARHRLARARRLG